MENYFEPNLTDDQLRAISSIGLAHMGDAVFEVLVRTWLCAHGKRHGKGRTRPPSLWCGRRARRRRRSGSCPF